MQSTSSNKIRSDLLGLSYRPKFSTSIPHGDPGWGLLIELPGGE